MTVYLVGAGPGDPDLITRKGWDVLGRADVIVHDRLVEQSLLDVAAPWAEVINVGKDPNAGSVPQSNINSLLVDRGTKYETVVRLKGGDPFVFGRGGEEAQELISVGIEVEVVPGVSSAVAAPAAAGIPVTMRGVASGVTIVTAHQDPGTQPLDWDALARAGTTLVILMGAARRAEVAVRLQAGGMAPDTPVAIVSSATTAHQAVGRTILANLGHEHISNPATIVVGPVADLDVLASLPALVTQGTT
ncbi:MAG: uroporphyrinogen-III C-methyltransferase [Microthrixaceae bacterium]